MDVAALPAAPAAAASRSLRRRSRNEEPPPELLDEVAAAGALPARAGAESGHGRALIGDFAVRLAGMPAEGGAEELDRSSRWQIWTRRPRVIFQRMPDYPPELRKRKRRGTVYVDVHGRRSADA